MSLLDDCNISKIRELCEYVAADDSADKWAVESARDILKELDGE